MSYNPELVKLLLGDQVAELFDGTIKINKSNGEKTIGDLKVGDTITFNLKTNTPFIPRQFVITEVK